MHGAMRELLSPAEVAGVLRLLGAVLHLGNVSFAADGAPSPAPSPSRASTPRVAEVSRVAAEGEAALAHVERLLACPSCGSLSLRGVLLARGINVAGDSLSIPRSPAAAARARDVVAHCLY